MNIRTVAARWVTAIFFLFSSAGAFGIVVNLPKYNVSVDQVSVSGLSSGAYMAAQMHFAYSNTIRRGAGIMAGGPVFCSQGNIYIALGPCMADTGSRDLPALLSVIQTWSATGAIDSTDHLSNSRVYLLSGTLDTTVRQPVMDDLRRMYARYLPAANIAYKNDLAVAHAVPTDFYGNSCGVQERPYINNCNFDAAGEILRWIYGPLKPKNTGA